MDHGHLTFRCISLASTEAVSQEKSIADMLGVRSPVGIFWMRFFTSFMIFDQEPKHKWIEMVVSWLPHVLGYFFHES